MFAKETSLPIFDTRVYFGVINGATDAEKHGESKFTAKNAPKSQKTKTTSKTKQKSTESCLGFSPRIFLDLG